MSVTAGPPPSRRGTRGVVALARAAALALGLSLALSACGVRVETPPPPLPSPGPAEVARQGAAQRATAIALDAESALAGTGDEALRARLTAVAAEATAHAEALGGIWAPPGWATPAGSAEPGPGASGEAAGAGDGTVTANPAPAATAPPDPAAVLDAIAASATLTCTDAVAVEPADLATLLASICLAQDAEARDLAAALGVTEPASAADAVVGAAEASSLASAAGATPEASLAAVVAVAPGGLALAAALDAAAYGLEIDAARSGGAERDVLADRAAQQRAMSQAIVASAGALGTSEDPRRAAYDLGPSADPAAQATAIEADLLAAWTAVIGDVAPEARPLVLAQMLDAQAAAQAGGAPSSTFPGLPELSA